MKPSIQFGSNMPYNTVQLRICRTALILTEFSLHIIQTYATGHTESEEETSHYLQVFLKFLNNWFSEKSLQWETLGVNADG